MGSDVDKVAEYRAFVRMRRELPQSYTSYEMRNFSRFLIKVSLAVGLSQDIGILMSFSAGIACPHVHCMARCLM